MTEKKNEDTIGYIYRLIGTADDKYVEEMLDDSIAAKMRGGIAQKRRNFYIGISCAAAAAVLVLGLGVYSSLGGIKTSDGASGEKTINSAENADVDIITENAGIAADKSAVGEEQFVDADEGEYEAADIAEAATENDNMTAEDVDKTEMNKLENTQDGEVSNKTDRYFPKTFGELADDLGLKEELTCSYVISGDGMILADDPDIGYYDMRLDLLENEPLYEYTEDILVQDVDCVHYICDISGTDAQITFTASGYVIFNIAGAVPVYGISDIAAETVSAYY